VALTLNVAPVGGSQMSDYKCESWPKDLVIANVSSGTVQDLQTYARANRAPFALLIPNQVPGDTSNHQKYVNMAKSLHAGGQVCASWSVRHRRLNDDRWQQSALVVIAV
jgi:hypothetical protein